MKQTGIWKEKRKSTHLCKKGKPSAHSDYESAMQQLCSLKVWRVENGKEKHRGLLCFMGGSCLRGHCRYSGWNLEQAGAVCAGDRSFFLATHSIFAENKECGTGRRKEHEGNENICNRAQRYRYFTAAEYIY